MSKEKQNSEPTSILDLPDDILELILSHLNQLNLTQANLINWRFYKLAKKKLFSKIFVNNGQSKIQIASDLITAFYISYTVISNFKTFENMFPSLDMKHIRKIVFETKNEDVEDMIRLIKGLCPDVVFSTLALHYATDYENSILFISKKITSELVLWVHRLEIDDSKRDVDFGIISYTYLPNLNTLEIYQLTEEKFNELMSIDKISPQIKNMALSLASPFDISPMAKIFNLERISFFQLVIQASENNYSSEVAENLRCMLGQMKNLKHLGLSYLPLDSATLISILKPDSLLKPTSILDLPDDVLELILSHLNQLNLTQVNLINSRFYKLAKKKLYSQIFVNNGESEIQMASDLITAFYISYTVINNFKRFEKMFPSLNMKHIRKIVFETKNEDAEDLIRLIKGLCPNLDFSTPVSTFKTNHDNFTLFIKKHIRSKVMPWVKKLGIDDSKTVVDFEIMSYTYLPNLNTLEIYNLTEEKFNELMSIDKTSPQIEQLALSLVSPFDISPMVKLFNLERISFFQLKIQASENNYSSEVAENLRCMLGQMKNLKHLGLSYLPLDSATLVSILESDSLLKSTHHDIHISIWNRVTSTRLEKFIRLIKIKHWSISVRFESIKSVLDYIGTFN
ncbi:hypothetical protein JA1_000185 [Spathaspora sp. JA1]|nr:hypothetical protein JA1_000185 [Spathaspora sp. JA1]